jgi:hypothetical protein
VTKPQETDERLRGWLDADQQKRERLCAALLSLDHRFSQIKPRRPKGGPDQGRDIEALFENRLPAFAAVGFVNGAHDSPNQKRQIKAKFQADLRSALKHQPDLGVFIFFTNIDLTPTDMQSLEEETAANGNLRAEIFHRERMRILLDSPSGFAFRYQYLDIKMSDEEQATFFEKFGSELQNLITRKFTDIDRTLERIEFFADKSSPLTWLQPTITLDKQYEPPSLVPFRVLFEFHRRGVGSLEPHFCIAGEDTAWSGDWKYGIRRYNGTRQHQMYDVRDPIRTPLVEEIPLLGDLTPNPPIPTLGSLDQHEVSVFMSKALASKVRSISLVANVYEVGRMQREDIYIESTNDPPWWPENSDWPDLGRTAKNLSWVELTRATGLESPEYVENVRWLIDFYRQTPERHHL